MELQKEKEAYAKQGLGLAAISQDPPEITIPFSREKGIEYPLLNDIGSEIIRRYGLLNTQIAPDHKRFGIPFPGTFVLDAEARVTDRVFEQSYRTRFTGKGLALRLGADPGMSRVLSFTAPGDYLEASVSVSDSVLAPGQEFMLRVDVAAQPGIHVYAPGDHPYQAIRFELESDSLFTAGETDYPGSDVYHFEPLDEHVPVFKGSFRVLQPMTLEASRELSARSREPGASVTLRGKLVYQACDEKMCFVPEELPFRVNVGLRPFEPKSGSSR